VVVRRIDGLLLHVDPVAVGQAAPAQATVSL